VVVVVGGTVSSTFVRREWYLTKRMHVGWILGTIRSSLSSRAYRDARCIKPGWRDV
jgi:hypothetical protein